MLVLDAHTNLIFTSITFETRFYRQFDIIQLLGWLKTIRNILKHLTIPVTDIYSI